MKMTMFQGTLLLFAVEREAKAFIALYLDLIRLSRTRWLCDGRILVELLGVGAESARSTLQAMLVLGAPPKRVIVAGFAGALREGLSLGDVIVASEVVDEHGGRWPTTWPEKRAGRVLTCGKMIGDPAQKKELGTRYQADVVEMEAAAIAEICRINRIPFGCIRVVSDDVNKPLSQRLMSLVESGRVSIRRVLWEAIRSPRMCVELMRLAKQTRFAAAKLAQQLWRELRKAD